VKTSLQNWKTIVPCPTPAGCLALAAGLALVCGVAACAPETSVGRRWVELDLALGPDGPRVISTSRASTSAPPVSGATLSWTLVGAEREVIASGRVADTREVRFEDLLEGDAHETIPSEVGVVTVRVPQAEGTLVLRDATGLEVGRVAISTGDQRVSRLALMERGDVLGPATQVHAAEAGGLDILFLPEGYTEEELPRFHEEVEQIVAELAAQPDYARHWDRIGVWRRDVRSRTSGVGSGRRPLDTAFDVAFGHGGTSRCAWFATSEGRAAAERLRGEAGATAVAILANSDTYGGCGSDGVSINTVTSPSEAAQVVAHELGHALFGLADEYTAPSPALDDCIGGLDRPEINVSDSATELPWADLVPGSGGTVGAFEGAHYCARGRYRPSESCLMRSLHQRMCPVCARQMERVLGTPSADATGEGMRPEDRTADVGRRDEGAEASAVATVAVVNRTGASLWARCHGAESRACSGWVRLEAEETARIATSDRRLVVDNEEALPGVSIDWFSFTASSARVEIFANAENPLVPPSDSTATVASEGAGGGTAALEPVHLSDAQFDGDSIGVAWDRVSGASHYWVYAMAMSSRTRWVGYTGTRVSDTGARGVLRATLSAADLCAEAGRGEHGLVVQVMAGDDPATADSRWLASVGSFHCD
jgi:hypothetical protein